MPGCGLESMPPTLVEIPLCPCGLWDQKADDFWAWNVLFFIQMWLCWQKA